MRRVLKSRVFTGDDPLAVKTRGVPLPSDGACERLLRLAVRPERKVVAHHIDHHGRKHQTQCYPELPIMMRARPVRTLALTIAVVIVLAMVAVTAFILTHGLPAFLIPIRVISAGR